MPVQITEVSVIQQRFRFSMQSLWQLFTFKISVRHTTTNQITVLDYDTIATLSQIREKKHNDSSLLTITDEQGILSSNGGTVGVSQRRMDPQNSK